MDYMDNWTLSCSLDTVNSESQLMFGANANALSANAHLLLKCFQEKILNFGLFTT